MRVREFGTVVDGVIEVHVPITFRAKGSAKRIIAPDGAEAPVVRVQPNSSMVKALARSFRWRRLLEDGKHATLSDLAKAEKINPSYVSRILRLTLLAPNIVETVLDGDKQALVCLASAMQPFPVEWEAQRAILLAAH